MKAIQTATDIWNIEAAKERIRFLASTNDYTPRVLDRRTPKGSSSALAYRGNSQSPPRQPRNFTFNGAISSDTIKVNASADAFERVLEVPSPSRQSMQRDSDMSELTAPSGQTSWYEAQEGLIDADDVFNRACEYESYLTIFLGCNISKLPFCLSFIILDIVPYEISI